jgi:2-iminobutanoate/2-iminopropanoate deaminase
VNTALFKREHSLDRHVINTEKAPAAVGPYSQAIKSSHFVFTSGQIGINPLTGQLRIGIEEQARQVITNLAAVLSAAGSGTDRILKTSIFLTDMADFAVVNRIYAEVFEIEPPARSTFQVAALPLGALIEIEAIALVE